MSANLTVLTNLTGVEGNKKNKAIPKSLPAFMNQHADQGLPPYSAKPRTARIAHWQRFDVNRFIAQKRHLPVCGGICGKNKIGSVGEVYSKRVAADAFAFSLSKNFGSHSAAAC
jgi:hypothetical protein